MTILWALQWGVDQLQESGVNNPNLDAEVLLAHCLRIDRIKLYVLHDKPLDRKEWERYEKYIARRAKRVPVAYITGYKEFRSLGFRLMPTVLIPRPETEILVEETLKECAVIEKNKQSLKILELGTGSGIIAVSLAKEIEHLSIIATDISLEALKIARENARLHKQDSKIHFFVCRFLQAINVKGIYFDFIVSNPPYLSTDDWKRVQPEVRDYEPPDALLGGEDGLDFYRIIIPEVSKFLTSDGWLILEVGMGQADKISRMIKKTGKFSKVEFKKDLSGIARVVKAKRW